LRRAAGLALPLFAITVACGPGERPVASPAPTTAESPGAAKVRPMTSRDDSPGFAAPTTGAALPPGHPPVEGAGSAGVRDGAAVAGTVSIAPGLAARLATTDVLYMIARNHETNAVVAVRRAEGVRLPHAFALSAEDAMVKDRPFSGPFDLTARLSKSGDAIAAAGDLEGNAANVAEGARSVSIVIDKVRQ
jgi:hypothetical protein